MIEQQFKSICRLNRLLFVALMAINAILWWRSHGSVSIHPALWCSILAAEGLLLLVSEFSLRLIKRLRETELETLMHLAVISPCVVALTISLNYALTGNLAIYLLGCFGVLESHFLGQTRLSRMLAILYGALFCGLLFLGYPHPLPAEPLHASILLFGFGGCLYYYGTMVAQLVRSQASQVGKLQSLAATDGLTGLTNRRQFNARLHEEIARAGRHETPLSLALFDLDDFKHLNDFYGHPVGDRILKELGKLIRQNIRESDHPARYGGEEFALILPETRESEAYELLERIRLLVAQTVFCLPENPLTITISVGVAQLETGHRSSFELVELADKALYAAKKQGKNQVVKASSLMSTVILTPTNSPLPF